MALRGVVVSLVLLALVLVPVLAVVGDDGPGPGRGAPRETGLRHQPPRLPRTVPGAIDSPVLIPRAVSLGMLDGWEPSRSLPLLVRIPFVPPRS
jgi:hypothetical protein